MVDKVFEDAYTEKLSKIYDKSKEARDLEKRRMLILFKKFMFKSRILTYDREDDERMLKQVLQRPYKNLTLTEKWTESHWEHDHPDLVKSPLALITKTIGRVSLTPAELAKAYFTDPDARNNMDLFTLDKEELLKL